MKLVFKQRNQLVPFHLEGFIEALGEKVEINGTYLFSVNDVLELKGSIRFHKEMSCDLCLEPFIRDFNLEFDEDVHPEGGSADHLKHNGSEFVFDELVYEEYIVNCPDKIKCSEDCRGLCYKCGANLNLNACKCSRRDVNPRFQMLEQLLNEDK